MFVRTKTSSVVLCAWTKTRSLSTDSNERAQWSRARVIVDIRTSTPRTRRDELVVPDHWDALPAGDAFVTRRVKAAGADWLLWRPRGRNRPHRRLLGIWAPRATIEQAQALAKEAAEARGRRRVQSSRPRDRQEMAYRQI